MKFSIKISTIGYSTMESIPVFHYDPGHTALRIITAPRERIPVNFTSPFLNELNRRPSSYSLYCTEPENLLKLLRRWEAKALFFDGIEPLSNDEIVDFIKFTKSQKIHVGARTQGFLNDYSILKILDFIIVDIDPNGYEHAKDKINVYDLISEITKKGHMHTEIIVHLKVENPPLIIPLINNIKRREVPLHIKIYEVKGLGYAPFLKITKNVLDYVYVHAGGFSLIETKCPKCGTCIAVRDRGYLVKLVLGPNMTCPKCGMSIPFRGDISESTPKKVIRRTRGEVIWYHPKALPIKIGNC